MDFSTSKIELDFTKNESRESLNKSLQSIGLSPIKTHSMPKYRRISYANEKLDRTVGYFKQSFAAAVAVEENSLVLGNEEFSAESVQEFKRKTSDLDKLTEQIREKLTTGITTYEEKVQILTLTPESWTIQKIASYFGVSEYQVRQTRELKKSRGVLVMPDKNRGKNLPESTAEKVLAIIL